MALRRKRTFCQSLIARNNSIDDGLPRLGVLAGRNDGTRARGTVGLPAVGPRRASGVLGDFRGGGAGLKGDVIPRNHFHPKSRSVDVTR